EPLAADVRDETGMRKRHRKRVASLKLVAGILGCSYDDLNRRDQQRAIRRNSWIAAVSLVLAMSMSAFAFYVRQEQHIDARGRRESDRQRQRAEQQTKEAQKRLSTVQVQRSQNALATGNHLVALAYAVSALPGQLPMG